MDWKRHFRFFAATFVTLSLAGAALAAEAPEQAQPVPESMALTVYNDGYAIVKEVRSIDVPTGTGEIRFEDVAKTIDPTSVTFRSLTDPDGTTILEQNYEYDLVSADKILDKYLGKPIVITTQSGTSYGGTLMSFDPGQVVVKDYREKGEGGLHIIARQENVKAITTGALPEGLIVKPTLMWLLQSATGGKQSVEVAYSASQCSWNADYIAVLDEKDTAFDLSGWVTLTNNSGKTYRDARLKLVAGEVHRVEAPQEEAASYDMLYEAAAPQFQEKAFGEYHLYTLPRPTTIKDNQVKQIELLNAAGVPVAEKKYLFDPMRDFHPYWQGPMQDPGQGFSVAEKGKVLVFIAFKNDEKSHLGMPLPAGKVRMFKRDGKDLELVGEDSIKHTPKDERVELQMGTAFDISGERLRTNFAGGNGANWMEESFQITLRNHKADAVKVDVREHLLRWTNWTITAKSQDFTKLDAQTIEFPVQLRRTRKRRSRTRSGTSGDGRRRRARKDKGGRY